MLKGQALGKKHCWLTVWLAILIQAPGAVADVTSVKFGTAHEQTLADSNFSTTSSVANFSQPLGSVQENLAVLITLHGATFSLGLLLAVALLTVCVGAAMRERYPLAIAGFAFSSFLYVLSRIDGALDPHYNFDTMSVLFALILCVVASELIHATKLANALPTFVTRAVRFVQILLVSILGILVFGVSQPPLALLQLVFFLSVVFLFIVSATSFWIWRRGNPIALYSSVALVLVSVSLAEQWRFPSGFIGDELHWVLALASLILALGFANRSVRAEAQWSNSQLNTQTTDRMMVLENSRREFAKEVELFLDTVSPKDYEEVVLATFLAHLDRIIDVDASAMAISHRGKIRIVSRFLDGEADHFTSVLLTRESLLESVCLSDRAAVIHPEDMDLQTPNGSLSTLCVVPIATERSEWAGVVMARTSEQDFQLDEMTLVKDYSEYVRDALRHAMNFGQMRRQAETDSLTGLHNRRAIMGRAERAFKKARSMNNQLSLLFIDLDDFKHVNDTHGHEAGDQALRKVATVCKECLREGDAIGRFGGEEFIAVLPGADAQQAGLVAERIRTTVASSQLSVGNNESIGFTLSIGISEIARRFSGIEDMVKAADRALYSAKREGRNRVVHHLHLSRGAKKIS